jgi:hypothetical protein
MSNLTRAGSTSINERYNDILDQYCDKSFVYSVLCQKSSSYFNRLKYALQLPLIVTSTVLTYINSNNDENMLEAMRIVNPIFNLTTAILLAVNNMFKFESKANDFKNNGIKFQKLSHLIEQKMLESPNNINQDLINSIITQFDNITENCTDVPGHICRSVHNEFATKKHLPIICNGVAKIATNVFSIEVVNDSHNESPRVSPRVLKTKPSKDDYISRLQA